MTRWSLFLQTLSLLHHFLGLYCSKAWDGDTNAPSSNFVYDFDVFRFYVRDDWRQVLEHSADGDVTSGSVEELARASARGLEVKVGVRGLCTGVRGGDAADHEVFIHLNSCYYQTESRLFNGATHPFVRVQPSIPLRYTSRGWDFGWAVVRTDGYAQLLLADPYTLDFRRSEAAFAMRWFVR